MPTGTKPTNLRVIFQSVAALAALRNPGHILMYAPRISSFAALPQIEIYSVKGLCPGSFCLLPCCKPNDLALAFGIIFRPQTEIYSVKVLQGACYAFSSRIFRVFFTFFSMRWRFSGERWSINNLPLRWSISCWRQPACNPSASRVCSAPFIS